MIDTLCTVKATRYTVSVMPDDEIAGSSFDVAVEYRGFDRWAVTRGSSCLSRSGEWEYEVQPSSRDDEWLDEHRFTKDEALAAAKDAAPLVVINGIRADEWAARKAAGAEW